MPVPGGPAWARSGVDLVAEGGELLGDAVVDVAGDPVALLEARELAQLPKSRPAWRVGAIRRVTSLAHLQLRPGEGLAVGPLRHEDGRRAVAQGEGHDERAPAARGRRRTSPRWAPTSTGRRAAGPATWSAMCPRRAGRAAQGDGHQVLGVLGDEDGAAGRGHLGCQQVERQGRAGRRVEAGGHLRRRGPAGAGSARSPRARRGRRPRRLFGRQPLVPGAQDARGATAAAEPGEHAPT